MSLLDAHIPQLVASQSAFGAKAGLMRSTIGQAEQEAMSSQAFFAGDGAAAFQAAHARFVAAAAKVTSTMSTADQTYMIQSPQPAAKTRDQGTTRHASKAADRAATTKPA